MMRRGYVDTAGGQVHVRLAGAGEELVLLLHQTAASSAMFERFAAAIEHSPLMATHRFIAIDTPGFGQSFTPRHPYSLTDWAETVLEVATAQGADSFHLLGHHTGAAVAVTVAAAAPERVRSLGMIGALGLTADERSAWHASVRGMRIDADGSHLAVAWHQVATIDSDPQDYPPDLDLRQREVVDKLSAGERWHEAYLAVFESDITALLADTGCPAILISGRADVLHPYVAATLAARPGISYLELDAGAYVLDQTPSLVADPYATFLSSIGVPA